MISLSDHKNTLSAYIAHKSIETLKIIYALVCDTLVLCAWRGVAMFAHWVGANSSQDPNDIGLLLFEWAAPVLVFVFAAFLILQDIVVQARELLKLIRGAPEPGHPPRGSVVPGGAANDELS